MSLNAYLVFYDGEAIGIGYAKTGAKARYDLYSARLEWRGKADFRCIRSRLIERNAAPQYKGSTQVALEYSVYRNHPKVIQAIKEVSA